jgi:hypothetical protein
MGTEHPPAKPGWSLDAPIAPWRLAPSDFAFLYDECPRCFYMKVVHRRSRPRSPFPSVFGRIDAAMKDCYVGERADEVVVGLPPGIIGGSEWVKSEELWHPGASRPIVISGQLDSTVARDDGTLAILDFKTSEPRHAHVGVYGRQLHAYTLAVEHPASGRARSVSQLGLVCFKPDWFREVGGVGMLGGEVNYVAVPVDRMGFEAFLARLARMLDDPSPPAPSPDCPWCTWLRQEAS